jgi:Putative Actinobacterial Holin-X, holin superfamily III
MAYRGYERSIPDIIADLLSQFPTLVRKESQLARAEISEKISQVGMGVGLLLGGAILLIPALVILLQAGVTALEQAGFQPPIASLIAGAAAFLVGLFLLLIGVSRMKVKNLVPQKTIQQIQEDASVAKQQVQRAGYEQQRAA